jgi:hypothetical protein
MGDIYFTIFCSSSGVQDLYIFVAMSINGRIVNTLMSNPNLIPSVNPYPAAHVDDDGIIREGISTDAGGPVGEIDIPFRERLPIFGVCCVSVQTIVHSLTTHLKRICLCITGMSFRLPLNVISIPHDPTQSETQPPN